MVALANSGLEVDFQGLSANQSWPQDYNEAVVRSSWIYDVDVSLNIIPMSESTADNPGSTGLIPIEQTMSACRRRLRLRRSVYRAIGLIEQPAFPVWVGA